MNVVRGDTGVGFSVGPEITRKTTLSGPIGSTWLTIDPNSVATAWAMASDRSGDESVIVAVSRTVFRSASPVILDLTCETFRSTPVLSMTRWATTSLLSSPTYEVMRRVAN